MKRILTVLIVAAILSGCSLLGSIPEASDRRKAEAKASFLEDFQINSIFHNIIRASLGEPLTFMRVNGTSETIGNSQSLQTNTGITGQPTPNSLFGSVQPLSFQDTANLSNNSTFGVDILDDAQYKTVFLNPVPIEYVEFFVDNHRPKTVIYTLLIDQIKITQKDGSKVKYNNNPMLNNYQDFQDKLYDLIKYKMEPQLSSTFEPIGVPLSKPDIIKNYGTNFKQVLAQQGISILPIGQPDKMQYQLVRKKNIAARMCISRNSETETAVRNEFGPSIFCEASPNEEIARLELNDPRQTTLTFRSTSGIFDFLGEVVYSQLHEPSYTVMLPPIGSQSEYRYPKYGKETILLNVKEVNFFDGGDNFAQIETRRNKKYIIPEEDIGYSKVTIRILSQILRLNDIPSSAYSNVPSPLILQNGSNTVQQPYAYPIPRKNSK